MRSLPSTNARLYIGVIGLLLSASIVWLALASYTGFFKSTVPITIETDRAGLGLAPGSDVTLLGVKVGSVKTISSRPEGGARLKALIDADAVSRIPADVTADIDASTVFGPKVVRLETGPRATRERIAAGAILQTREVTPESNDLYVSLNSVLATLDVGKLNAALSGVSQALDGRGDEIGVYVGNLARYVGTINESWPAMARDIRLSSSVADQFADNTPDLMDLADNVSSTSQTVVALRSDNKRFFVDLTRASRHAQELWVRTGEPLIEGMAPMRPGARVLAEFAPEYECVIRGLARDVTLAEAVMGIDNMAGAQSLVSFHPGQEAYKYPDNLPKNVLGLGPDCYGLPMASNKKQPAPRYLFDDGTRSVWDGSGDQQTFNPPITLYDSLFGASLADLLARNGASP